MSAAIKEVEKTTKKHKVGIKATHDLLDALISDLGSARDRLKEASTSAADSDPVKELQGKIRSEKYLSRVTDEQKDLYNAASKLSKVRDELEDRWRRLPDKPAHPCSS